MPFNTPSSSGGGGVTSHNALTNLSSDDHPQYLNNARGDARYSRTRGLRAYQRVNTADWYVMGKIAAGSDTANNTYVAGTYYLSPHICERTCTVSDLMIALTAAGGAGAKARIGIYTNVSGTVPYPDQLVINSASGELSMDSTTGTNYRQIYTPGTAVVLNEGQLYWSCYQRDNAASPATIRAIPISEMFPLFGTNADLATGHNVGLLLAGTYGTLPVTFPVGASPASLPMPAIGIRIAS